MIGDDPSQRLRAPCGSARHPAGSARRSGSPAAGRAATGRRRGSARARRRGRRAGSNGRAPACRDAQAAGTACAPVRFRPPGPRASPRRGRQFSATIPRSWVISRIAAPVFSPSSRSRSRIRAAIETSRPVVGSSAISSCGDVARAIAIITRWHMPPESWWAYWPGRFSRIRDADQAQHLERAACAPRAPTAPRAVRTAALICRPTGMTGLSAVRGLCEISAIFASADLPHLRFRQSEQVLAVQADRPADDPSGRADQAQDRRTR